MVLDRAAVLLALLASCNPDTAVPGPNVVTCNNGVACDLPNAPGSGHICNQYCDVPAQSVQSVRDGCPAMMGTIVAACSTVNLVGSCTLTSSGIRATAFIYERSGVTAASLKSGCEMQNGTWTSAGDM